MIILNLSCKCNLDRFFLPKNSLQNFDNSSKLLNYKKSISEIAILVLVVDFILQTIQYNPLTNNQKNAKQ